jgi:carboxylesterase
MTNPDPSDGGAGPGALVLHGFTGAPSSVQSLADAFAAAGFDVELPLLPGHGTHVADMIPTRWHDWSSAVEAAYARLAARSSAVVVAGLSMGGTLTLWTALNHPEVAAAICVNPAAQPQPIEVVAMLDDLLAQGVEVMAAIGSDIAMPDVIEEAYPETPVAPLRSLLADGVEPVAQRYGTAQVPLLVFTSRQDHVVDPAQSDFLADAWSAPVERVWLENSFHVATQDFDSDVIAQQAVAFARRHVG